MNYQLIYFVDLQLYTVLNEETVNSVLGNVWRVKIVMEYSGYALVGMICVDFCFGVRSARIIAS